MDLSGAGLMIGGIGNPQEPDPSKHTANNTASHNTILNVSQEYHGTASLIVGYTQRTLITHNELGHVSYSGISLSWGWGAASFAGNNHIANNHIHHIMCGELLDGGAIYTLGPQPGSTCHGNYLHNQCEKYGVLYHDGGSGWWNTFDNVVAESPNAVWLLINAYTPTQPFDPGPGPYFNVPFQPPNHVHDIFVDNTTFFDPKTGRNTTMLHCNSATDPHGDVNCTATYITVVADGEAWPAKAQAIIDNAGPKTEQV
jgi:hypothetical protein